MKRNDSAGFSIVELVLAIVVGLTFISSMNLVVDDYTHLGKRDRSLLLVNSFAEAEVEQLRNNTYNSLNLGTTSLTSQLPSQLSHASGTMTVSQAQTGLKQIDISISYNDLGTTRTYTYRTYEGELGVGQ